MRSDRGGVAAGAAVGALVLAVAVAALAAAGVIAARDAGPIVAMACGVMSYALAWALVWRASRAPAPPVDRPPVAELESSTGQEVNDVLPG